MLDYNAHVDALRNVLEDRNSFRKAIFRTFSEMKLTQDDRDDVKETLHTVLRHYFRLTYEANNLFPSFANDDFEHYLALIALAKYRYLKADSEEVDPCLEKSFEDHLLISDVNGFEEVINNAVSKPFVIPEEIKKYPDVYASLTFDMPDFLIRDISDQFERDTAQKVIRSLRDIPDAFYVSNHLKSDEEPAMHSYSLEGYGIYRTNKLKETKDSDAYKEGNIIPMDPVKKLAFERCNLHGLEENVLLVNQKTPYYSAFINSELKDTHILRIDAAFPRDENYRRAIELDEILNTSAVNNILSTLNLVKTFVEFDTYDAVFVRGEDLSIGKAGIRQEVLPCLKEKDFRISFNRQLGALKESSYFVKPNGLLILTNSAVTKEETTDVSKAFLASNKRFEMVEEKLILPFEHKSEGGYYCIFRRTA